MMPFFLFLRKVLDTFFLRKMFSDPFVSDLLFSRASVGARVSQAKVILFASANIPRFDYDFKTGELLGLLYEPQRTNQTSYAQDFANGWWGTQLNAIKTPNYAIAPDGSLSACRAQLSTYADSQLAHGNACYLTAGQKATCSLWVKANTLFAPFNMYSWSGSSGYYGPEITPTEAWVRHAITFTAWSDGWYQFGVRANTLGDKDILVWGAQCEVGENASSYIPTGASSVTRAADQLSFTIPQGVSTLRYTFDDNSTQDVNVTGGAYTVPTNLNRSHIKRIQGFTA